MSRSSRELKRISRDILNNRYTLPMGAFLTAWLIPTLIEIPFSMSLGDYPTNSQLIISCLAEFLIMLIAQVLAIGRLLIHLDMTRAKECRLVTVFSPFRYGAERYFGASLFYVLLIALACTPGILATVWFSYTGFSVSSAALLAVCCTLALVLTVIVMLNYRLTFLFLLDYPQMKVHAAFKECRRMMKKNRLRLLYIFFSFLGWCGLIVCSFGIAALWAVPYMTQTLVTFYLDCTGELDRIPVRGYSSEPHTNLFF